LRSTGFGMMSIYSKDFDEPRLDAEDRIHACPAWIVLSLTLFGVTSLTVHYMFG